MKKLPVEDRRSRKTLVHTVLVQVNLQEANELLDEIMKVGTGQ